MSGDWFEKLRRVLEKDEGVRFKPYMDTTGNITIGVGHNLSTRGVTYATVLQILGEDMDQAEKDTVDVFGKDFFETLEDNRKIALCSLLFNLGKIRILAFQPTIALILKKDWAAVKMHLLGSKWAGQVKGRAERIASMLCDNEYPYGGEDD